MFPPHVECQHIQLHNIVLAVSVRMKSFTIDSFIIPRNILLDSYRMSQLVCDIILMFQHRLTVCKVPHSIPGEVSHSIPGEVSHSIPGEVPHSIPGEVCRHRRNIFMSIP